MTLSSRGLLASFGSSSAERLLLVLGIACWSCPAPAESGIIDVRSLGAKGDGVTDDTKALAAAVATACKPAIDALDRGQGGGGTLLLPRGVYRITDTLRHTCDALHIRGEGIGTSAILLDLGDPRKDGVVVGDGTGAGRKSTISDLSIYSRSRGTCRDGLKVDSATWFKAWNVSVTGVGRFGVNIGGGSDTSLRSIRARGNGDSGFRIGNALEGRGIYPTTLSCSDCNAYENGRHGVLVERVDGAVFTRLIAEQNGKADDPSNGTGITIGTVDAPTEVTLVAPYFEENSGWDVVIGVASHKSAHHVAILNPFVVSSPKRKQPGYGFVLALRTASGGIFGGRADTYRRPVETVRVAPGQVFQVSGLATLPDNPPHGVAPLSVTTGGSYAMTVTISGSGTSGSAQITPPELDTGYVVLCVPSEYVGRPTPGSAEIERVTKTSDRVTLNVREAPGAGSSRTFDCLRARR